MENKFKVNLNNISVIYESKNEPKKAIDDISFSFNQGEFIAVVGPSGCGKTTLLNILAGYLKPTEGMCLIGDKVIEGPSSDRGIVFQTSSLFPWYNVEQNILYGNKIQKKTKEQQEIQVNNLLSEIGLLNEKKRYPHELSGGMKQRVSLARSLANEPKILLLDEPFAALDAITRNSMQILINDIWKKHQTTNLMITHDIDEALVLATRILVMSSSPGKIIGDFEVVFSKDDNIQETKKTEQFIELKTEIEKLLKM